MKAADPHESGSAMPGQKAWHAVPRRIERSIAIASEIGMNKWKQVCSPLGTKKTSVRRVFSLRCQRLLPPKSPILGDFEPEILA
ncbi:hypothetical protein C7B65_06620 [Phormidesmis priestleyi ULC007]|uniref:Uncharacterized protein n=1 Tax=Phormidesmis priestleyi ULC007 TaxID=1920490 RepID=A0A2T1DJC6_9CYAN|nr:hypothetical protein [Phormidesmis priestleyi]PSB20573.1 hypothetical protein C7B65_06620 [Phormidesmis priestleyi ULC007]PZO54243.1 MAG: hypothetical protein DCF14_02265 [Phormidesmis priestleyi]